MIFENIIPKLRHENDGLIFTKEECPYYPGTCEEIIKWKPKELNTIDFILKRGPGKSGLWYKLMTYNGKSKANLN